MRVPGIAISCLTQMPVPSDEEGGASSPQAGLSGKARVLLVLTVTWRVRGHGFVCGYTIGVLDVISSSDRSVNVRSPLALMPYVPRLPLLGCLLQRPLVPLGQPCLLATRSARVAVPQTYPGLQHAGPPWGFREGRAGWGHCISFNPHLLSSTSFFPGTQASPSFLKPAGSPRMLPEG